MLYAVKTYTIDSITFPHTVERFEPGQVEGITLSVEIVRTKDPAGLEFDPDGRGGDVIGGYDEFVWNGSITLDVYKFNSSITRRELGVRVTYFTDSTPGLPYVEPVISQLAADEESIFTVDDIVAILEANGFEKSGYMKAAERDKETS